MRWGERVRTPSIAQEWLCLLLVTLEVALLQPICRAGWHSRKAATHSGVLDPRKLHPCTVAPSPSGAALPLANLLGL